MLKQKSVLEIKIGERTYLFHCESDSPLGEVHDAICQMRAFVVQKIVDQQKVDSPVQE
jgi:hypothetical protein